METELLEEAVTIWETTKSRLEGFISLGEGSFPPFTDAGRTVENMMFDALENISVQLNEKDLEPAALDPLLSAGDTPIKGLHLNITRSLLMRFSHALRQAAAKVEAELSAPGEGFRPGQVSTAE